jgi:hypothetical protein
MELIILQLMIGKTQVVFLMFIFLIFLYSKFFWLFEVIAEEIFLLNLSFIHFDLSYFSHLCYSVFKFIEVFVEFLAISVRFIHFSIQEI